MNSNRSPVSPSPNARPAARSPLTYMFCAGLAVVAVVALGSTSRVAALQDKTTADSVYSDDQSKRGEGLSEGKCSVCHGEKLIGTDLAPGLQGDSFLSTWSGRTAGDLYEKIQTTMPADAPGSLNPQQATDIVAYVFKLNKFPSGGSELPKEQDALKAIKIRK